MLQVEGLVAGYGPLDVLHGIDFTVPNGAMVAVLGPNGAGKTTIMRALSGLIRPRGGTITLDGRRVERVSAEGRVRLGASLVPEGRELFGSLTVRENLLMGAYTQHDAKVTATDIERILTYFPRLREHFHRLASNLSGGEGQMLAIGRALMARPRLLLLDEPSQGLAPAIVDTVFDVITRLNRDEGLSILLVEQNARQALGIAQSAYVLQGGAIALQGDQRALQQSAAVQELYLGG